MQALWRTSLFAAMLLAPFSSIQADPPHIVLSDSSSISLVTGGPAEDLYTRFGHSAIRVKDPRLKLDWVFNYGTFDFDTQWFYLKFIRGKLPYSLAVYDFALMYDLYRRLNVSLFEQELNLTPEERQKVMDFLMWNYEPENRYYHYDSYFDNCSSRIRDVFHNILGDTLEFRYSHVKSQKTFRDLTRDYLNETPWGKFGIDLITGLHTDKTASPWERMFLPYEMMYCFENAVLRRADGVVPFAKPVVAIFGEKQGRTRNTVFSPLLVFWGIFVAILAFSAWQQFRNLKYKWLDILLFFLSGFLGGAMLFMWFGTDHPEAWVNLNMLWALPTNIIIAYFIWRNPNNPALKYLLIFSALMLLMVLVLWKFNPQHYHLAVIPIILSYLTRSIFLLRGFYLGRA
jgi:hypothetical protein